MNLIIGDIHFTNAIFIYLLPVFLLFFYMFYFYFTRKNSVKFLFIDDLKKVFRFSYFYTIFEILLISLIIIVFFLIFAGPNRLNVEQKIKKNGIDIVFAFDVSGSMDATDIRPSRLEGAKSVIVGFLDKFKTDRVGLVVFAGRPYSSIPLTFDYNILKETFTNLSTSVLNQRTNEELAGTAVGDAILLASNLFEQKDILDKDLEREKVIILITDGDATKGVDPLLATKLAKEKKVKIYTIGVGSEEGYISGFQRIPPLNDKVLKEIALKSDGKFYRVTDNDTLKAVFSELEMLQKNDIEIKVKKSLIEYYSPFLYILIFLMFLYIGFRSLIFRR